VRPPRVPNLPRRDPVYERAAKASLYADDKAIYLSSPADYHEVRRLLHTYELASGAKINTAKSSALLLGAADPADWTCIDVPILKDNETTTYLGFTVGPTASDSDIWDTVISKLDKTLARWRRRDLSLLGRLTVIKTLATSKLWYIAALTPIPPTKLQALEKQVWAYLWRDRPRGLVRREVALSPRHHGGLGALSIPAMVQALQMQWLKRLCDPSDALWKDIVLDRLREASPHLGLRIVFATSTRQQLRNLGDPLWTSILGTAQLLRIREQPPQTTHDVLRQHLLRNRLIMDPQGRPLSDSAHGRLITLGIHTVRDLIDPEDLAFKTPRELGIPASLLERVVRALPRSWSDLLLEYPRLVVGDFVATTRNLPISRVLRVARVRTHKDDPELVTEYHAHEFFVDQESVLPASSLDADALADAPRLRVPLDHPLTRNLLSVAPHRRGLLVEALADSNELPSVRLQIDQLVGYRVVPVPISSVTVRGTRGALVALHAQRPTFAKWDPAFTAWSRLFKRASLISLPSSNALLIAPARSKPATSF